jgi:hypothetical protein
MKVTIPNWEIPEDVGLLVNCAVNGAMGSLLSSFLLEDLLPVL